MSIDVLSFQFASLVEKQPAIDRAVVERDARPVVEVDESGEIGIARNERTHPSAALLVQEGSDALVDRCEFLRIAEADAVLGIEEDGSKG